MYLYTRALVRTQVSHQRHSHSSQFSIRRKGLGWNFRDAILLQPSAEKTNYNKILGGRCVKYITYRLTAYRLCVSLISLVRAFLYNNKLLVKLWNLSRQLVAPQRNVQIKQRQDLKESRLYKSVCALSITPLEREINFRQKNRYTHTHTMREHVFA